MNLRPVRTAAAVLAAVLAGVLLPGGHAQAATPAPIVFTRHWLGGPLEDLYSVSPSGGFPNRVTATPDTSEVMPAWRPDGLQLAYARQSLGEPAQRIWTTSSSGPVPVPGTEDGRDPVWSPDGKRIAFAKWVGGQNELFVVTPGYAPVRLTYNTVDDLEPSWSPDGIFLVFTRRDAAGHQSLVRLNPWQMEEAPVTPPGTLGDSDPDWSRTGWIVFSRTDTLGTAHLYVCRPDGTSLRQITAGRLNDTDPAWSPDGSRLVFSRGGYDDTDPMNLFTAAADGSGLTQVTFGDTLDFQADWGSP
ncbi:TolB family protein [Streptomyces sp. NPDC127114]|uniref:TolB family protein n=1 Tax=Streptomyces sp. NPDC127114 TaxID=3345366 RepID=UPI00364587B1